MTDIKEVPQKDFSVANFEITEEIEVANLNFYLLSRVTKHSSDLNGCLTAALVRLSTQPQNKLAQALTYFVLHFYYYQHFIKIVETY